MRLSNNGVPVNVEAVGLVRIDRPTRRCRPPCSDSSPDSNELQRQINEILAGSLRGITATMTVEDLNSNRDTLARSVVEEAGSDLARIGMEVDVLKIAGISDRNGYPNRSVSGASPRSSATPPSVPPRPNAIRRSSAKARQEGSTAQAQGRHRHRDRQPASRRRTGLAACADRSRERRGRPGRSARPGARAEKAVGIARGRGGGRPR